MLDEPIPAHDILAFFVLSRYRIGNLIFKIELESIL